MSDERRRYLRVLFEETIQVETTEWSDPMATGLDISLNGVRFHCEHSLNEGGEVKIVLEPGLEIPGKVRWCWPIEWYYQAAVEFLEFSPEEQIRVRDYISEKTGEDYPEDYEIEEAEPETGIFFGEMKDISPPDVPDISIEEDLERAEISQGSLTPLAFANKHIVIVDDDEKRTKTIQNYLTKRNHFSVAHTDAKSHLWPLLKGQPADLILLSWSLAGEDGLEMLQGIQQRFPETPVIFLGGVVSLEDQLSGLNEGAVDFLTRPLSLSTLSQSILKAFAFANSSQEGLVPGFESDVETFDFGDELELSDDFLDEDLELE